MALTTASNVADLSGGSVTASEPAMADLISQAGIMIARYCGYPAATAGGAPTMESATYTHYSGTSQVVRRSGRDLVLEPYPVTAITSIYDDPDEEYTAAELVASSDYVRRGLHGEKIRLKSEIGRWVERLSTARPAVFCEHEDTTEFAVAIVEQGVIVC